MRRRHWNVIAVLSVPLLAVLALAVLSPNSRAARVHRELSASGAIDTRFDRTLSAILAKLESDIDAGRTIVLNRVPGAGEIGVFVVNPTKVPALSSLRKGGVDLGRQLKLNAIAIEPDIVLVDSTLIALTHVSILADHSLIDRAVEYYNADGQLALDAIRLHMLSLASANQMRFKFIRMAQGTEAEELGISAAAASEVFEEKRALQYFYLGAMLVLAHEIGHLTGGGEALWPESLNPADWLAALSIAREERADSVMMDVLKRELTRAKSDDDFDSRMVSSASLVTVARLLREMTLFDAFEEFRGMGPEQLFSHFDYHDCRVEDGTPRFDTGTWSTMAIWPRTTRMPLLTRTEFGKLRIDLGMTHTFLSHPPRLMRAGRMLSELEVAFGAPTEVQLDALLLMLSAYGENPRLLYPLRDVVDTETGLPVADLVRHQKDLSFEESISCPPGWCEVASISDGLGHIEVIRKGDQLVHARAILKPTFSSTEGIVDFAVFARLLHNLLPQEGKFAETFTLEFIEQRTACGVASRWVDRDGYWVAVTSLPYDHWVVVDVLPKDWVEVMDEYHLINWPYIEQVPAEQEAAR